MGLTLTATTAAAAVAATIRKWLVCVGAASRAGRKQGKGKNNGMATQHAYVGSRWRGSPRDEARDSARTESCDVAPMQYTYTTANQYTEKPFHADGCQFSAAGRAVVRRLVGHASKDPTSILPYLLTNCAPSLEMAP
ncbi:hypothetical protein Vretimale_2990, partial [Volvox reticuliferus]